MATTVQSLIPAPLTGTPFLKASHFQIGFDHRPQGNVVESPFRTDFPPLWGNYKPVPILPPNSKGVLNQDMDKARETWSETHLAFPVRALEPMSKICPPESHLQMHADSQTKMFTSTARESYPWPDMTLQGPVPSKADYNKEEDHFPCGDKDKLKLLPSVYRFSYPAYDCRPIVKAPCIHLGGVPTIKGDRCSYFGTSYQAQFEGVWIPPVKSCGKSKSSVVFGDPRSMVSTSEKKHAYPVQDMRNRSNSHLMPCRVYDRERAAFQIHKTNIKPGDGHTRFYTVTLESFPLREIASVEITCPNKQTSSLPRGDEDLERSRERATTTTSRFFHTQIDMGNCLPQPDVPLWRRQSNVPLGDKHLNSCFFSTTQHSDYQPPPENQREMPSSKCHHESHVPFNYPSKGAVTTTQAMLVPYRQRMHRPSEESLQQIKYSHLVPPWKGQRFFGTEHQDEFTPKYSGPVNICGGNFQVSSVPLGMLKKYGPRDGRSLQCNVPPS
ncbi:stabilizer of axonemal microtubules 5 isoform X2 [Emydura macquarii macquarii]|uniref:stabilizer of axonemal microtubules 5 isoform X2 n=1 Tax=Emydura macquarii macquarii TaxID=1129001 RepID=UPI00352A590F